MGAWPDDAEGSIGAIACMADTAAPVPAGIEQVLTKKTGQEERTVEGMAERREGDGLLIPLKRGRYLPRHCEPLRV